MGNGHLPAPEPWREAVRIALTSGPAAAAIAAPETAGLKTALYEKLVEDYGNEMDGNSVVLPNVAPDEGLSAPFNDWMTFFGQFTMGWT